MGLQILVVWGCGDGMGCTNKLLLLMRINEEYNYMLSNLRNSKDCVMLIIEKSLPSIEYEYLYGE